MNHPATYRGCGTCGAGKTIGQSLQSTHSQIGKALSFHRITAPSSVFGRGDLYASALFKCFHQTGIVSTTTTNDQLFRGMRQLRESLADSYGTQKAVSKAAPSCKDKPSAICQEKPKRSSDLGNGSLKYGWLSSSAKRFSSTTPAAASAPSLS